MSEKRIGLSITGAIVLLSLAILFAGFQISSAIRDTSNNGVFMQLGNINENFGVLIETLKENNESQ